MKIKKGQTWKNKKDGSLLFIGNKHDGTRWNTTSNKSKNNHAISERNINKYYTIFLEGGIEVKPQYADVNNTIQVMEKYRQALDADMDIDEEEMWKNIINSLEEDLGEKIPKPTIWQIIKCNIKDFLNFISQ